MQNTGSYDLVDNIWGYHEVGHAFESYPLHHSRLKWWTHGVYPKKITFSAQRSRKTGDFEKNQYPKYGKNSLNTGIDVK